jgi:hypothetical protein
MRVSKNHSLSEEEVFLELTNGRLTFQLGREKEVLPRRGRLHCGLRPF